MDKNLQAVPMDDLTGLDNAESQVVEQGSEVGCCFPIHELEQMGCIAVQ